MNAITEIHSPRIAVARERARIETALHHEALQALYAVAMALDLTAATASPEVAARIDRAVGAINGVIASVRTAVRPPAQWMLAATC